MSAVAANLANWGAELAALADRLGVEPAVLHAIAAVEVGEIPTEAGLPVIRFEVHVCLRRTERDMSRAIQLRNAENLPAWHKDVQWYLCGALWERVHSGRQATEWGALAAASAVDPVAAIESASWGVGQLMGFHWSMLGYRSPQSFAARAMSGVPGQLRQWGRFLALDHDGALLEAARAHDWESLVRLYNGPGNVTEYCAALQARYEEAADLL